MSVRSDMVIFWLRMEKMMMEKKLHEKKEEEEFINLLLLILHVINFLLICGFLDSVEIF